MYGSKTVARCVGKVKDGVPILTVANEEGVSEKTVRIWCRNANVRSSRGRWTTKEKETAARMWNGGSSCVQISVTIGRTVGSVKSFLRKNRDVAPCRRNSTRLGV